MEQTKALNALEPFLALTKSASSPRAAADLITKATSSPQTYIFTSLYQSPQIQSLAQSDQSAHLRLLEIFTYGTYSDYTSSTTPLPSLNPAQTAKLRQLSLLTLASQPSNLTYATLQSALDLSTAKELENLIISSIYAGLLTATLDPSRQTVIVSSIAPLRDVVTDSLSSMISIMQEWETRCTNTLAQLEEQIRSIKAEAAKRAIEERAWNAKVEKLAAKAEKDVANGVGRPNGRGSARDGQGNMGLGRGRGGMWGDRSGVDEGSDEDAHMDLDDDENSAGGMMGRLKNFASSMPGKGAKKRGHGTLQ